MPRVEIDPALLRDLERVASRLGIARSILMHQRLRQAIAMDVVDCDQAAALARENWMDRRKFRVSA